VESQPSLSGNSIMNDDQDESCPYPSAKAGPVDRWSLDIYAALESWSVAQGGTWERWEPGYLVLTIGHLGTEVIDPVVLYTAEQELVVIFGYWDMCYPDPYEAGETAEEVAANAKRLVEEWISGEIRTAVAFDASGKWCGTKTIELGELEPELHKIAWWLRDFGPATIEIRSPRVADWKVYNVQPEWQTTET
jgi:hypothetical protein